jgi:hypothetical protein
MRIARFGRKTYRPIFSASCTLQPYAFCSYSFEIGSRDNRESGIAISSVWSSIAPKNTFASVAKLKAWFLIELRAIN